MKSPLGLINKICPPLCRDLRLPTSRFFQPLNSQQGRISAVFGPPMYNTQNFGESILSFNFLAKMHKYIYNQK
jgi:hypothetical protein